MRTMRAAVLYESRRPMVVEAVELDDPGPGEVLVKIAASGVCRSDLHVLNGEWTAPMPIVLGHEASGRVVEVGPGVTRTRAGVPISDDVPLDLAALVGCSVTTGVGAVLNTAGVPAGSSVVVVGCGGVGLNVLQGARLVNAAPIIAVDVAEDKLAFARRFGATDVVDARDPEALRTIRRLTDGGVDFAFEALGTGPTIRLTVDAVRPGGTAVIVGMAPHGEEAALDAYLLTYQEKTVKGCFYGSTRARVDMPRLIALAQSGKLDIGHLVTRRAPLDQINEAYAALDRGDPGRG